jgi:hypothetical protein
LKLEAYQVATLIKRWDQWTIKQATLHLKGNYVDVTEAAVERYAQQINRSNPELCKPKLKEVK